MHESEDEVGVIVALMERFERQRLPRLLALKEKVDRGEVLDESDIAFIEEVTQDAQRSKPLMDKHPEWHKFCANVVHLYETITEKALENEKRS